MSENTVHVHVHGHPLCNMLYILPYKMATVLERKTFHNVKVTACRSIAKSQRTGHT